MGDDVDEDPCIADRSDNHVNFESHDLPALDENFRKINGTWEAPRGPMYNEVGHGPQNMPPNYKHLTPIEMFTVLFPVTLMQLIAVYTNVYIEQEFAKPQRQGDKLPERVTVRELYVWVGLHIKMMRNWCGDQDAYWRGTGSFDAREHMSYRRFYFIKRWLHFNDTAKEPTRGQPDYDPLYKMRPLIETLNATFGAHWKMCMYVSLDEMMLLFKGKNPFHRYVRGKPHPNGFKLHAICDAIYYFCGAFLVDDNEKRTIADIASTLFQRVVSAGMTVVTDRFYTCKGLVQFCLKYKVGLIGSTMGNRFLARRELPGWSSAESKNRARGDFECAVNGDKTVCCIVWKDKATVRLTCTASNTCTTTVKRRQRGQGVFQVWAPTAAAIANQYFHGVDRNDQLRGHGYGLVLTFRALKYTIKLFLGMLDLVLSNSWILWRTIHKSQAKRHGKWIMDLAEEMLKFNPLKDPEYSRSPAPATSSLQTKEGVHLVRPFALRCPSSSRRYLADCRLCASKMKRKRTVTGCFGCNIPLCSQPSGSSPDSSSCHEVWHSLMPKQRSKLTKRMRVRKLHWQEIDTIRYSDASSSGS